MTIQHCWQFNKIYIYEEFRCKSL